MGEQSEVFTVPARRGRAARLDKGQAIKVVNTHGQQVVDFWAFNAADLGEYLSMERYSPRSAALKAQKSTTCWPWVLTTLIAWPLSRRAARPRRAGTVKTSLCSPMWPAPPEFASLTPGRVGT